MKEGNKKIIVRMGGGVKPTPSTAANFIRCQNLFPMISNQILSSLSLYRLAWYRVSIFRFSQCLSKFTFPCKSPYLTNSRQKGFRQIACNKIRIHSNKTWYFFAIFWPLPSWCDFYIFNWLFINTFGALNFWTKNTKESVF